MYKMVILILSVKYKILFMIKQQANVVLFQIKEKAIKCFWNTCWLYWYVHAIYINDSIKLIFGYF